LFALVVLGSPTTSQEVNQKVVVKVGGYDFEPFVENEHGITPAFLALLNNLQDEYQFEFVHIPAQRRYSILTEGHIDAIFFEMPRWGWEGIRDQIEITKPLLRAKEAFYARANHPAGAEVFARLEDKKLALTLGFHYAFADFNSDQAYIRERFNASFAPTQRVALRMMLAGSADLVIMSDIFLYRELARNPALKNQLIRSPNADQTYALPLMVRKAGPVSVSYLEGLLEMAREKGLLTEFFKGYAIDILMTPVQQG
jgi:ABC-type amino acid transport substrate-binding protein